MLEELVLFFTPDKAELEAARRAVLPLGMSFRPVEAWEFTQTVGFLAGLPGQKAAPRPPVPPRPDAPVMVLSGISRARMDVLFDAMRREGAPPPDRKAVLTPTNAGWTLAALCEELGREHEAMHGKGRRAR